MAHVMSRSFAIIERSMEHWQHRFCKRWNQSSNSGHRNTRNPPHPRWNVVLVDQQQVLSMFDRILELE
jgi:hypothetical protein